MKNTPTKAQIESFVKSKLATSEVWAVRALVRIFEENQTADEKTDETTRHDNGIGFSGRDAAFLSSLAKGAQRYGSVTPRQLPFLFRSMPKYWAQVVRMSDAEKLKAQVLASLPASAGE